MLIKAFDLEGTKIKIMDDYMVKTEEENQRIKEHLDSIADRINERINQEEMNTNENCKQKAI